MTTREIVYTDKVNPPMHVFSQATKAGNIVYTSGNTGNTLDGKLKAGTCADRTTQALDNLDLILKSAGSGLEHALKVTVFLSDYSKYDEMNKAYDARMPKPMPARSCIGVKELPMKTDVEIEVTALIPEVKK